MRTVDLNCDLGEGTGTDDLALLDLVTSANIACGGHAGDEASMAATVEAALARGVAIGAHPGYPDRANFGRVALQMAPQDLGERIYEQIWSLDRVARRANGQLTHVKLHGALYHKAMTDVAVAAAAADAAARFGKSLAMVAMPNTVASRVWQERGMPVVLEAFADRVYETDGSLRSRSLPGALITDASAAAAQAARLVQSWSRTSGPHTVCIHSDTLGAAAIARSVRNELTERGVAIAFSVPYAPAAPAPRSPVLGPAIPSAELLASQVPSPGSTSSEIFRFAATYDLSEMNPYGRLSGPIELISDRESLTGLRAHLFFEYRRWNHFGRTPDAKTMEGLHRLLELIRVRAKR